MGKVAMPKHWLYFIALVLPLVLRVLVLDLGLESWMWYHGHPDVYYTLTAFKNNVYVQTFLGGWPLPVFCGTIAIYWQMDADIDSIPAQFLLLPVAYVPFTIAGHILVTAQFHPEDFYTHPLIIIPVGYAYVFIWVTFIWMMEKLQLVL